MNEQKLPPDFRHGDWRTDDVGHLSREELYGYPPESDIYQLVASLYHAAQAKQGGKAALVKDVGEFADYMGSLTPVEATK